MCTLAESLTNIRLKNRNVRFLHIRERLCQEIYNNHSISLQSTICKDIDILLCDSVRCLSKYTQNFFKATMLSFYHQQ